MPFQPFHAGSTTVAKKSKVAPPAPTLAIKIAPAAPPKKNATRVAKPSGAGPRGSAGYFTN